MGKGCLCGCDTRGEFSQAGLNVRRTCAVWCTPVPAGAGERSSWTAEQDTRPRGCGQERAAGTSPQHWAGSRALRVGSWAACCFYDDCWVTIGLKSCYLVGRRSRRLRHRATTWVDLKSCWRSISAAASWESGSWGADSRPGCLAGPGSAAVVVLTGCPRRMKSQGMEIF